MNKTTVTISSKVLLERSNELIHAGNIESIYTIVKEHLNISLDEFLNGYIRSMLEVTTDVKVKNTSNTVSCLHKLSLQQSAYSGKKKAYTSSRKAVSFGLKREALTKRNIDYLSIYVKKVELLKLSVKENQLLLNAIGIEQREALVNYYEGRVRIETKLHSLKMIRKHFELSDKQTPTLLDVLNSTVPVNKNMFEGVYKKVAATRKTSYKSDSKKKREFLLFYVLKDFDLDIDLTAAYINSHIPYANKERLRRDLKDVLINMDAEHQDELVKVYEEALNSL